MLAFPFLLAGCFPTETASSKNFVGKWKSSRLTTPIHLHENGEWEILDEKGSPRQYGVWQYKDGTILWSYNMNGQFEHEPNRVLAVSPQEFKLLERNGSSTTFTRLAYGK